VVQSFLMQCLPARLPLVTVLIQRLHSPVVALVQRLRGVVKRGGALLQAMQEAFATSVGRMFTSGTEEAGQHMVSVEAATLRSGAALEAEFGVQDKNFLAGMPQP